MRISDWSSDVCSSDLDGEALGSYRTTRTVSANERHMTRGAKLLPGSPESGMRWTPMAPPDRKSVVVGRSVSVRVDLGGRRIITNKKLNVEKCETDKCTQ